MGAGASSGSLPLNTCTVDLSGPSPQKLRRIDSATGMAYLTKEDIRQALNLDSTPQIARLLDDALGSADTTVSFDAFMRFVRTGKLWIGEDEGNVSSGSTCSTETASAASSLKVAAPRPPPPVERIVCYTTVDVDGRRQELTERERHMSNVVHMECRETGEFAHRETTDFEAAETFNGDVVLHESGNEEYVHLKSRDDEYEHMESCLPERAKSMPCRAPPGEALNNNNDATVAEDADDDIDFGDAAGVNFNDESSSGDASPGSARSSHASGRHAAAAAAPLCASYDEAFACNGVGDAWDGSDRDGMYGLQPPKAGAYGRDDLPEGRQIGGEAAAACADGKVRSAAAEVPWQRSAPRSPMN
ncbi:hypothetical protein JKP88DRAFT_273186 [Tribonema minus]|uniref:Uncharacterized protein n=1 Tax=Tribonema minus TaxID=303371 RepID=A0A836CFE9_9STRA|nr:hypothetical protein JKP88DRAFT_273186 [Tribonema minus]